MRWLVVLLMVFGVIMIVNIIIYTIWMIVEVARPPRKETNGEYLRSYSDEELAEFLTKVAVYRRDQNVRRSEYKKMFLNWLKQETDS